MTDASSISRRSRTSTANFAEPMFAWVSESEIQGRFTFSQQTNLDFGHFSTVNWYLTPNVFSVAIAWTHSTRNLTIQPQSKGVRETFRCFDRVSFIVPRAVWVEINQLLPRSCEGRELSNETHLSYHVELHYSYWYCRYFDI